MEREASIIGGLDGAQGLGMKVNKFFINKLAKSGFSFESKEFSILLEKSKFLSSIGINSNKDIKSYKLVRSASERLNINISEDIYRKAIAFGIENQNDANFFILKSYIGKKGLTKVAYPNSFGYIRETQNEVDINKWLKTVHLIYDSIQKGEMTKHNALDYYSNFLDKESEEDVRFKKWFEYYSSGEHLKYSSNKERKMKKEAIYMSNLGQSAGTYTQGGGSSYVGTNQGGFNMPGDSLSGSTFDEAAELAKAKSDDSEAFSSWKGKLHAACRRLDRLLRSKHMDGETYKVLAEHLLNLSHQVQCLKLASTISDVTYKTASTLERHGQKDVADVLVKIAQEVPEQQGQASPVEQEAAEGVLPESQPEPTPAEAAPADPNDPKSAIPSSDDVDPVDLKDILPIPGARPGEYEELAGDVSLDDAAQKLDEVAGMLADRRIIRQLAEFDIMLDKIGIASMFPELAESQSKLIDAFSYALTRVTKMMGQLANAKSIIDSRSNLPGAPEQQEPEPQAPEPQAPEQIG